jgi:hypothetical protein
MDLNNIEYRDSYPNNKSNKESSIKTNKKVKKKKTPEDWARIDAWRKKQEKQRIENLTTKIVTMDGEKVRVLKSTSGPGWGNVKRRARPRHEVARINRINDSK